MLTKETLRCPRLRSFDYLGLLYGSRLVHEILQRETQGRLAGRLLDVGCGAGSWKPILTAYSGDYVGLDIKPGPAVDIVASATDMPLGDGEFDVVYCDGTLEHICDYRATVSEIHRVLKPDGVAIVGTHGTWEIHGAPHDYWRWTPFGFQETFKAFSRCEVIQLGGPIMNFLLLLNIHWRRLQIKWPSIRWLFSPFIIGNNLLGRFFGGNPRTEAVVPVYYFVVARR